jgi:murein DD-endopeptidase MepM/ murein hydrolase activator NlpD
VLLAVLVAPTAHAEPFVQAALARRHHLAKALGRIEANLDRRSDAIARELVTIKHHLARSASPRIFDPERWASTRRHVHRSLSRLTRHLNQVERASLRTIKAFRAESARLTAWLQEWGTLRTCPIDGPNTVANNFGVVVDLPDVPVHVHQGNDIMAATGTPIVAPFAGTAVATSSELGGLEVTVKGPQGYAYNAHLSTYGQLGDVRAGDVIGYVGSTGDATAPHDHFEWHPDNGPAVDPNPLLSVVC